MSSTDRMMRESCHAVVGDKNQKTLETCFKKMPSALSLTLWKLTLDSLEEAVKTRKSCLHKESESHARKMQNMSQTILLFFFVINFWRKQWNPSTQNHIHTTACHEQLVNGTHGGSQHEGQQTSSPTTSHAKNILPAADLFELKNVWLSWKLPVILEKCWWNTFKLIPFVTEPCSPQEWLQTLNFVLVEMMTLIMCFLKIDHALTVQLHNSVTTASSALTMLKPSQNRDGIDDNPVFGARVCSGVSLQKINLEQAFSSTWWQQVAKRSNAHAQNCYESRGHPWNFEICCQPDFIGPFERFCTLGQHGDKEVNQKQSTFCAVWQDQMSALPCHHKKHILYG